jgi:putative ABC transport system ATP-binding protein
MNDRSLMWKNLWRKPVRTTLLVISIFIAFLIFSVMVSFNVATALQVVGLADRAKHRPREMSGGQQQRVAIARAIVADPKLVLADEPTGDLDRTTADEILSTLQVLNRDLGKTIIMVTHDAAAAKFAKRVLHLDKGRFDQAELAA